MGQNNQTICAEKTAFKDLDLRAFEGLRTETDIQVAASEAVIKLRPETETQPRVLYRFSGDDCILIEYGPVVLDMRIRFRVYHLEKTLKEAKIKGLCETAPGVRSLWVKYDPLQLPLEKLMDTLLEIEANLTDIDSTVVTSRLLRLPIAYNDQWTQKAIDQYIATIRKEGPYLPDNMAFIARANGLSGADEVIQKHLDTEHMVLGLGDVYLGAPCSVPLDPRCRLVVPKYNPARTYTPEGGVGIGGTYGCIYPMASPGGYQLIGRTLAIWDTFQKRPGFEEAPWLLRQFDRLQYYSVSEEKLIELREKNSSGAYNFEISEGTFSLKEHLDFCEGIADETNAFKTQQRAAIDVATVGY
ncbi:hypothetical protein DID77_01575 [Candidatus Marinamargulisbacteria bacterium SCGC AG-439-L15]|nr:hypothetical protein DID77_01575 [Candidatus Marinamargulisbacteria bacterium SCGC AG-439-L15]